MLAKHSKSSSLIDCMSVGVDRMQRNFEPMRKQVGAWQRSELTDVTAKVVIYEAFIEGKLEAPKHLARTSNSVTYASRNILVPSIAPIFCLGSKPACQLLQLTTQTRPVPSRIG